MRHQAGGSEELERLREDLEALERRGAPARERVALAWVAADLCLRLGCDADLADRLDRAVRAAVPITATETARHAVAIADALRGAGYLDRAAQIGAIVDGAATGEVAAERDLLLAQIAIDENRVTDARLACRLARKTARSAVLGARIFHVAGAAELRAGNRKMARLLFARGLGIAEDNGATALAAMIRSNLALVLLDENDLLRADAQFALAHDALERSGNRRMLAVLLANRAVLRLARADTGGARDDAARAIALYGASRPRLSIIARSCVGKAAWLDGSLADAASILADCQVRAFALEDLRTGVTLALQHAVVLAAQGACDRAHELVEQSHRDSGSVEDGRIAATRSLAGLAVDLSSGRTSWDRVADCVEPLCGAEGAGADVRFLAQRVRDLAAPSPAIWHIDPIAERVTRPGGAQIDLSRKPIAAALLIALVDAGGAASDEQLSRRVWGVSEHHALLDGPRLHVAVHRLRKALSSTGEPDHTIERAGDGYRLVPRFAVGARRAR